MQGSFRVTSKEGRLVLYDDEDVEVLRSEELYCRSLNNATFTLSGVTIGLNFHWERKEKQTFEGDLRILLNADVTLTVINDVCLELYLQSVISSEMSAEAPIELLKVHAIISRSWLAAMLEHQEKFKNIAGNRGNRLIRQTKLSAGTTAKITHSLMCALMITASVIKEL